MSNINIDKILSFNWKKTIILILLGFAIFFYGLNNSYLCGSELDGVLVDQECASLNFWPHLFVKIGFVIILSPILTILYSILKYFRKNKNFHID